VLSCAQSRDARLTNAAHFLEASSWHGVRPADPIPDPRPKIPRGFDDFIDRLADNLSLGALRIIKKDQIAPVLKGLLNEGGPQVSRALQDAGLLQMDKLVGFYADRIAPKLAPDLQLPVSVVAEALRKLLQERRAAAPSIAPRAAAAPKPDATRPAGTAAPAIGSKSSAPKTPPSDRAARPKPGARKGRGPERPERMH
jgi:hypothetical protein